MANNVSNVSFSDYSAEQQDIERRRRMAEALQQQSMQPINNPMSGGYVTPISWTQGLAKMLQAYGGRKGMESATERQKALAERSKTEAMDFVSTLPQATTQDMNLVANDDEGNAMPPAMKTTQPDQRVMADALRKGMASGNPLIAQMVGPMYAQMLKQNDPYTLAPNAVRMQGDQVIAQGNPQQFRPPDPVRTPQATPMAPGRTRDVQMGTDKVTQELQADGTWKEIGRGPAFARQVAPSFIQEAPVTPVTIQDPKNPNATIIVDGRTGRTLGAGPKFSESGRLEANRQFSMSGIGASIQEAENLLKGANGASPTGSMLGSLMDSAGALVKYTPSGAKEADRLKVLGGALVSKVPRMQGPQSDKDVTLYKEMAGQVGNDKIPPERRLAALEEVKRLYAKYEHLNQEQPTASPADSPPPGAVREKRR